MYYVHFIQHTLDTMYAEKDIFHNILRTIIITIINGSKIRHDMQVNGIRRDLWIIQTLRWGKVVWKQLLALHTLLQETCGRRKMGHIEKPLPLCNIISGTPKYSKKLVSSNYMNIDNIFVNKFLKNIHLKFSAVKV